MVSTKNVSSGWGFLISGVGLLNPTILKKITIPFSLQGLPNDTEEKEVIVIWVMCLIFSFLSSYFWAPVLVILITGKLNTCTTHAARSCKARHLIFGVKKKNMHVVYIQTIIGRERIIGGYMSVKCVLVRKRKWEGFICFLQTLFYGDKYILGGYVSLKCIQVCHNNVITMG